VASQVHALFWLWGSLALFGLYEAGNRVYLPMKRNSSLGMTVFVMVVFLALLYEVYRETGWATTLAVFCIGILHLEE
jgi:hypothetical protein